MTRLDNTPVDGNRNSRENVFVPQFRVARFAPDSEQPKNLLHPFGLMDYTVSFLGYVMFASALGWEQVRDTGKTVRRYGRGDAWDNSDVEHI